jgi:Ser/Thr protein kinase RdoA (MazF antagonist)
MSSTGHPPDSDPIKALVYRALKRYGYEQQPQVSLISDSENLTFAVSSSAPRARAILRIYRPGYHDAAAVNSELYWLRALRAQTEVIAPDVIPATSGALFVELSANELPEGRRIALFEQLSGREPGPEDRVESFSRLGRVTALLHQHTARWVVPPGFKRQTWNLESMLTGSKPTWGRWRDATGMSEQIYALLDKAEAVVIRRLESFGQGQDQFGLIHADLRPQNLLVEDGITKVIDFDDCGFSWFLYDLAAAMTFVEDDPLADEMIAAWLQAYESTRKLTQDEKREIATFRLLRRMVVVAWLSSHRETSTARTFGKDYLTRAALAADKYLREFS